VAGYTSSLIALGVDPYLGHFPVAWSVANLGGSNASTAPDAGTESTFDAGWWGGIATWTANYNGFTDSVVITINAPTVNEIVIVDLAGMGEDPIVDATVEVGHTAIGFAAGFNTTSGYIGDVPVTWTVINNLSTAWTSFDGEFNSGFTGGNATWMADDGMGHNDTVLFEVIPPVVDYIMIVDTPGIGFNAVPDQGVEAGFVIEGWAASFNNSIGYMGDVEANWTVVNVTAIATTLPVDDFNSTFDANATAGTANWTATYGSLEYTVHFTIFDATVDYIEIVDTANAGVTNITDMTVDVGFAIVGYAAAFDDVIGYMYDVPVAWTVVNASGANAFNVTVGDDQIFYAGTAGGTATWTADYGGMTYVVVFTINAPTVDYIEIVDTVGTGMNVIFDQNVPIGFTI
ncbi:MAG: hypothetical protein KAT70_05565, partial [Thermoplasmata archaeon]|nr:hypothetical protein [Thermoplasmata archaeon]